MGTVLIVEDDNSIRESIRLLLEMEGYETMTAANGAEAIDVLKGTKLPDVILLDIMMPVMDGFEFREAQQSMALPIAQIPVVVLSADGRIVQKKARAKAVDYLRKPVEVDVLLNVIEKYTSTG